MPLTKTSSEARRSSQITISNQNSNANSSIERILSTNSDFFWDKCCDDINCFLDNQGKQSTTVTSHIQPQFSSPHTSSGSSFNNSSTTSKSSNNEATVNDILTCCFDQSHVKNLSGLNAPPSIPVSNTKTITDNNTNGGVTDLSLNLSDPELDLDCCFEYCNFEHCHNPIEDSATNNATNNHNSDSALGITNNFNPNDIVDCVVMSPVCCEVVHAPGDNRSSNTINNANSSNPYGLLPFDMNLSISKILNNTISDIRDSNKSKKNQNQNQNQNHNHHHHLYYQDQLNNNLVHEFIVNENKPKDSTNDFNNNMNYFELDNALVHSQGHVHFHQHNQIDPSDSSNQLSIPNNTSQTQSQNQTYNHHHHIHYRHPHPDQTFLAPEENSNSSLSNLLTDLNYRENISKGGDKVKGAHHHHLVVQHHQHHNPHHTHNHPVSHTHTHSHSCSHNHNHSNVGVKRESSSGNEIYTDKRIKLIENNDINKEVSSPTPSLTSSISTTRESNPATSNTNIEEHPVDDSLMVCKYDNCEHDSSFKFQTNSQLFEHLFGYHDLLKSAKTDTKQKDSAAQEHLTMVRNLEFDSTSELTTYKCHWEGCPYYGTELDKFLAHFPKYHGFKNAPPSKFVSFGQELDTTYSDEQDSDNDVPSSLLPSGEYQCNWIEPNHTNCFKIFKTTQQLNDHIISEHIKSGKSQYVCCWQNCSRNNKPFTQKQKILRHLHIHTQHKPHICQICHKSFSLPTMLDQHMRIHTGETPYCCTICSKSFKTSSSLTIHMRTHTGEKPLVCEYCGKKFNESSNLSKHLKIHMREFKCVNCFKSFNTKEKLDHHIKVCNEIKKIKSEKIK